MTLDACFRKDETILLFMPYFSNTPLHVSMFCLIIHLLLLNIYLFYLLIYLFILFCISHLFTYSYVLYILHFQNVFDY